MRRLMIGVVAFVGLGGVMALGAPKDLLLTFPSPTSGWTAFGTSIASAGDSFFAAQTSTVRGRESSISSTGATLHAS